MKKSISWLLCIILFFSFAPVCPAQAAEPPRLVANQKIEHFPDGSYIITELTESAYSNRSSVTRSKFSTYYDNDNTALWMVELTATFSYNGTSATCTYVSTGHTIYDTSWQVTNAAASKSGNTATGDFTVKKYFLGIPIKTVNRTLTLTCSPTGVVS